MTMRSKRVPVSGISRVESAPDNVGAVLLKKVVSMISRHGANEGKGWRVILGPS
jgi:hypothetical protein